MKLLKLVLLIAILIISSITLWKVVKCMCKKEGYEGSEGSEDFLNTGNLSSLVDWESFSCPP